MLRISTLLKLKIIYSQNTARKLYQFTNVPANMFMFGVRKIFVLPHFLMSQNYFLEELWNQMSVFLYISLRKVLFQRCSKILSGDGWERLNNFLKVACCLDLVKYFTIFHFNSHFANFNFFSSISILASTVLTRWNFTDNLYFKDKIWLNFS